jgi:hypothetical protein
LRAAVGGDIRVRKKGAGKGGAGGLRGIAGFGFDAARRGNPTKSIIDAKSAPVNRPSVQCNPSAGEPLFSNFLKRREDPGALSRLVGQKA